MGKHFVYILRRLNGVKYVGETRELPRRIKEHAKIYDITQV